jgi:hypothetical protein
MQVQMHADEDEDVVEIKYNKWMERLVITNICTK